MPWAMAQAQPGSAIAAAGRVVGLLEGIEQAVDDLRRDADAGIRDFEANQHVGILVAFDMG